MSRIPKQITEYKDIYVVDDNVQACKVKIKIIQEMIQITRPNSWNLEKINNINKDLTGIKTYNRIVSGK